MSAETRRHLIEDLEPSLGENNRVIAYVTGARQWKGTSQIVTTQIATDAVRMCYDHLASISAGVPKEKLVLNLFLYSHGGDTSVPWRLVSLFREFAADFHVIVPYTAMSAATLICLGADSIVMGRKGELGPIDPSTSDPAILKIEGERPMIGVEDVANYIAFVRDRCKIRRPSLVIRALELLANQLGPVGLGKLNRQHSYIRLVGERLLRTREKCDPKAIKRILRTLIEEVSFHGHAISRNEAKELGLHVKMPTQDVEDKIWNLYQEFEKDYEIGRPIDPELWLTKSSDDVVDSDHLVLAGIESTRRTDNFVYRFRFRRIRDMPPNINIQLQLPIGPAPSGPAPGGIERPVLQQITQDAIQQVGPAVQAALLSQCPVREVKKEVLTAEWRTVWTG